MNTLRLLVLVASIAAIPFAHAGASNAKIADAAGFTQRLGATIPGELAFRDESGRDASLRDFDGGAPIVLVFAWFGCTTLCPTVTANLAHTLAGIDRATDPYQVVVASIDPRDAVVDAARMKARVLQDDARQARSWHFLTGREDAIAHLAQAAGFRYAYDDATHQYAHPAGYVVLTPEGRISRNLLGVDFTRDDLRAALADADRRTIGTPVDRLLLLCFHFTPGGRYSATVMNSLRAGSAGLLALCVGAVVVMRRARR
jgi:protein SCO1/2